ncbi:MAG: MerC domain-containing protein [Gemmatimonadetes bacterium]|nr:MerC domain-containing protein [Gemmatimonadota bacterium]
MRAGIRDAAGVFGAILAALCCAGTPFIMAGLTALGLGFLRKDGILWPVMLLSLAVAVTGFWRGARTHGHWGPFGIGGAGAISLAAGVIIVHGFPAMEMIYVGAAALVIAAGWNSYARRHCERSRLDRSG